MLKLRAKVTESTQQSRTKTILLGAVLAFTLGAAPVFGGPMDERSKIDWLKQHQASLSFSDSDLSDLEALKSAIGNARVVLLGEEHGDGSTFLQKTRIVRFLHEQMGFDVLAWEANLYDCHKAWNALKSGEPGRPAAVRCMDRLWTESRQVQGLFHYLQSESGGAHPLELTGLDIHATGTATQDFFLSDLKNFLSTEMPDLFGTTEFRSFSSMLVEVVSQRAQWEPSADQQHFFIDYLAGLSNRASQSYNSSGDRESLFWSQVFKNLQAGARFLWVMNQYPAVFDPHLDYGNAMKERDSGMADNLVWLANRFYTGKKVIVWMNTGHIIRNADQAHMKLVNPGDFPYSWPPSSFVNMGSRVAKSLGNDEYVIAFTSSAGSVGDWSTSPWSSRSITTPDPISRGSFEDLANRAGIESAFFDLKSVHSDPTQWLNDPVISRFDGFLEFQTRLPELLDGLVYIRTMQPSTEIEQFLDHL